MSETVQEPRRAQTVVTSENLAEFAAQKLGLNQAQPEAAGNAEPAATEFDQAQGANDAKPAEEPERKSNPKIERRFSEITKQREAARQEAERERQARIELENRLKELETQLKPAQEEKTIDAKPRADQFNDAFEYAEALADWTADKRIQEEKQKEATQRAEQERARVMETWTNRVADFRAKTPDFDDLVGSADVTVTNEVRDAIFESDVGPQLLYYLAENTDVARKLQGMTPAAALRMIGKLEAKLEAPAPAPARQEPAAAARTTRATPPISPIKAQNSGPAVELDDNRQFHGSYQAWKAARLAGRIR